MNDAPESVVGYDVRDHVAWLTIDRPESRNALTPGVLTGLHAGFASAAADASVRAIIVTGAGDASFCSGADLKMMAAPASTEPGAVQPRASYADLLRAMKACVLPTIARVNGHCMAGGMGLLAACDLAVAVDSARFGLPEVKVGLFAFQVLSVLRPVLGARTLAEMTLTGEPLDARTAAHAGLINYAVPAAEFDAKVAWLAARIVDKSPTAQRHGKRAMHAIDGMAWGTALPYLEGELAKLIDTGDAREGRRAFAEKRAPKWTGT